MRSVEAKGKPGNSKDGTRTAGRGSKDLGALGVGPEVLGMDNTRGMRGEMPSCLASVETKALPADAQNSGVRTTLIFTIDDNCICP